MSTGFFNFFQIFWRKAEGTILIPRGTYGLANRSSTPAGLLSKNFEILNLKYSSFRKFFIIKPILEVSPGLEPEVTESKSVVLPITP